MTKKDGLLLAACLMLGGCVSNRAGPPELGVQRAVATRTTLQNKPLRLNFSTSLNVDCSTIGVPVVQVTQQPASGTTKVSNIQSFTEYEPNNQRAVCNKQKSTGTELIYIPGKDFVGTDSLLVDTIFPTGSVLRVRYDVVVR